MALTVPTRDTKHKLDVPDQAKGNPVYEQTSQDMPLFCCGRNCGRNSRITVFILGIIGIICSTVVCLSPNYFSFVSLRNDTFYDEDKTQPVPYEYATEANVGLFRYQIMEVFEYPWPPSEQRELFDAMHNRELERLAELDNLKDEQDSTSTDSTSTFWSSDSTLEKLRRLQNKFPDEFYDDDTIFPKDGDDDSLLQNETMYQNDTVGIILTLSPTDTPSADRPVTVVPKVLPGSNVVSRLPTTTPTSSPTISDPNLLIDVDIGVVKPYPPGVEFDSYFKNGQKGAMWAPILATLGLFFGMIEFCFCIYKCSWLPTALFLYGAFMFQMMTLFLFMSDDFCNYAQDCVLGYSGVLSVIAVIMYFICQTLICMTPRPPPMFNLCKKKTRRKKEKKKKNANEWDETQNLADNEDGFKDEPGRPTSFIGDDEGDNDGPTAMYDDDYDNYGNDGYDDDGYDDGDDGYDDDGYDDGDDGYDDDGYDDGDDGYDDDGYDDGDDGYEQAVQEPSYNDDYEKGDDDAYGDEDEEYDYDDDDDDDGSEKVGDKKSVTKGALT